MLVFLKTTLIVSGVILTQSCKSYAQIERVDNFKEQYFNLTALTNQSRKDASDTFKSLNFPTWVEGCLQAGGKNYGANPFLFAKTTQADDDKFKNVLKEYNDNGQDERILRDFIRAGGGGWKLSLIFADTINKIETTVPHEQHSAFRYSYYDTRNNIQRYNGDCGLFLVELESTDFGDLYSVSSVATVHVNEFGN